MEISIPLKNFYHRCLSLYRFGDRSLYPNAIKNSVKKFSFNPFISTECDVQVKLGGIIEEYFITNNLLFSVNAEMKIYDSVYKNARVDLSIHETTTGSLYTEFDDCKKNLKSAIEIKWANAVNPDYEFKRNLVLTDLDKLSSLPNHIEKFYVFLDEAEGLSKLNADILIEECTKRKIHLFTNNRYINYELNFPYGYNYMFWFSKRLSEIKQHHLFDTRENFLKILIDCFSVVSYNEETIEINLQDKKIIVYYANEFDQNKNELRGPILFETFTEKSLTTLDIKNLFEDFLSKTGSHLFEMKEDTYELVIK